MEVWLCGNHSLPGLSKRSSGLMSEATSSLNTDRSSTKKEQEKNVQIYVFTLHSCPKYGYLVKKSAQRKRNYLLI